jgi:hypothetical protein
MAVGGPSGSGGSSSSSRSTSTSRSTSSSASKSTSSSKQSQQTAKTSQTQQTQKTEEKKDEDSFTKDVDKAAGQLKGLADKGSKLKAAQTSLTKAAAQSSRAITKQTTPEHRELADSAAKQNATNEKVAKVAGNTVKGAQVVRAGAATYTAGQDIANAVKTGDGKDIAKAADSTANAAGAYADTVGTFSKANSGLTRKAGVVAGATGIKDTIQKTGKAADSIGKAMDNATTENVANAVGDTSSAVKEAAQTASGIKQTADKFKEVANVNKAAKEAAEEMAKKVGPEVAEAARKSAVKDAIGGAGRKTTREAAGKAAQKTAKKVGDKAAQKGARVAGKAIGDAAHAASKKAATEVAEKAAKEVAEKVAKEAAEAGVKAAAKAGAKAGAKALAKAGGRFVPGMNVAIAVADGAKAGASVAKAIDNPSAENIKNAAFDGITALGSAAAATNIPVVSQVGAAVSVVSDIAKSIW